MKAPISRQLAEGLIIPFLAITGEALYDLSSTGQERLRLNVIILIICGIPTIVLSWLLIDKKTGFKEVIKVRKTQRLFTLPFLSSSFFMYLIPSSLLLFGGLVSIFSNNDISSGLPLLLIGLTSSLLIGVSLEHSRIWFKDSFNLEDDLEKYNNTPKETFPAYQDGIFTYSDFSFTIQLDKEKQTIFWEDISLIKAYKIDQFAVDCIVIEIYSGDLGITINDQTTGHMKFMEVAEDKLTGFKKDWFTVVAFPAFETNLTIIYERQILEQEKGSH